MRKTLGGIYKMNERVDTVRRSIYYYDLSVYRADGESYVPVGNSIEPIYQCFRYIKGKQEEIEQASSDNERKRLMADLECNIANGEKIYILVDDIIQKSDFPSENKIKFRFVMCRENEVPYVEQDGKLKRMVQYIPGNFSIAEVTHCVIFPNTKVLGGEFNINGARPTAITKYLAKVYQDLIIYTTPKIKGDAFERVIQEETYSLFRISVKNTPEMKVALRDQMGLIGGILGDISDVDTYDIELKRRKTKKKMGFQLPFSIEDIKEFVCNNRDNIAALQVSQYGIRKDAIDLLSDKMVAHYDTVRIEDKAIVTQEMYALIGNFHDANMI